VNGQSVRVGRRDLSVSFNKKTGPSLRSGFRQQAQTPASASSSERSGRDKSREASDRRAACRRADSSSQPRRSQSGVERSDKNKAASPVWRRAARIKAQHGLKARTILSG